MKKVVVAKRDHVNWDATFVSVKDVSSGGLADETIGFMDRDHEFEPSDLVGDLYVPVDLFRDLSAGFVYNDLALYPFFQEIRQIIEQGTSRKGVFRLRRMFVDSVSDDRITGDLVVLKGLFGEAKHIHVKRSRAGKTPVHVIVTVDYGEGTMAHLDYTFHAEDRVEVEWSGIGTIVEFSSEESAPVTPLKNTRLPLSFSIESVLEHALEIDDAFVQEMDMFQRALEGGQVK